MRNPDFFLRNHSSVTTQLSFVETSLDTYVDFYYDWVVGINKTWEFPWQVKKERLQGPLEFKLNRILPLDGSKTLITKTNSNWLAFFSNRGEVNTPVAYTTRMLKLRSVQVSITADVPNGQPGSTQFAVADATQAVDVHTDFGIVCRYPSRGVAAHKESRWEFHESGEPLPFEETETYKAKRIKDRLTPEMLERYAKFLGIELFNPNFYEGEAYIVQQYSKPGGSYPEKY